MSKRRPHPTTQNPSNRKILSRGGATPPHGIAGGKVIKEKEREKRK